MTTTTDTARRFTLTKGSLTIILVQYVTGHMAATYSWSVLTGTKLAGHGKFDSDRDITAALRRVANSVTLRTVTADAQLRTLTWQALAKHEHVPASELRANDCLSVGGGNYVCVESAVVDGDIVRVRFEGNAPGVEHRFESTRLCNLSKRA